MFHCCVTRYSIERSSDPEKFFYIEITSGSLMTLRILDREVIGWHNITVLAMEMSTSHKHTHWLSHAKHHIISNLNSYFFIAAFQLGHTFHSLLIFSNKSKDFH